MKKVLNLIKKNIFGIIIGLLLGSISVYAGTKFYASDVSVNAPTGSGLGSNATLQDSLDELYSIADSNEEVEKRLKSLETKVSNLENKSVVTTLWKGEAVIGDTITLSDSYENYNMLIIGGPVTTTIIRISDKYMYWGGLGTGVNLTDTHQSISIDYGYAKINSNTSLTILNSGFVYELIETSDFINNKVYANGGAIATVHQNPLLYSPRKIYYIRGIK